MSLRVDNFNTEYLSGFLERYNNDLLKEDKIKSWIHKLSKPTVRQLEILAKKAKIPFGNLFLENPEFPALPIADYRTFDNSKHNHISLELLDSININLDRLEWIDNELFETGYPLLETVNLKPLLVNPEAAAQRIREKLKMEEAWLFKISNENIDLIKYVREKLEEWPIFIFKGSSIENNNRRSFSLEEFRGYSLLGKHSAIIFVNSRDHKHAQIFTIFHELVHICIGEPGVTNTNFSSIDKYKEIERYCNKVAAAILIPNKSIVNNYLESVSMDNILRLTKRIKISPQVFIFRLQELSIIEKEKAKLLLKEYDYLVSETNLTPKSAGGPNPMIVRWSQLGQKFPYLVLNSLKRGGITYRSAYKLIGYKGDSFNKFFDKHSSS